MTRVIKIKKIRPDKTLEELATVLKRLKGVEDAIVIPNNFMAGSKENIRYLRLEGNNDSISEAYTHICRAGYALVSSRTNSGEQGDIQ